MGVGWDFGRLTALINWPRRVSYQIRHRCSRKGVVNRCFHLPCSQFLWDQGPPLANPAKTVLGALLCEPEGLIVSLARVGGLTEIQSSTSEGVRPRDEASRWPPWPLNWWPQERQSPSIYLLEVSAGFECHSERERSVRASATASKMSMR
jgi:hypothetical protein